MKPITPFLWYDTQAEVAANLYVSIFPNSKIIGVTRYGDAGPGPKGSVMTVEFELNGLAFTALNGGPLFPFTEAVSFAIKCADQGEVDHLWDALIADGGAPSQCGWLKDRFGLSWQIVPDALFELMGDPDLIKAARTTQAMLQMTKLDIAKLREAHAG